MKEMNQRISAYIQHNFMEKVSFVAQESEGMSVQTTEQYMRVDCGMPADTFNIGVLRADDGLFCGAIVSDVAMVLGAVGRKRPAGD